MIISAVFMDDYIHTAYSHHMSIYSEAQLLRSNLGELKESTFSVSTF